MKLLSPQVVVTAPPFCNSPPLVAELSRYFPNTVFNDKGWYLTESELIGFLKNADAAIVRRDPITEVVLRELPRLKIISKYGVGADTIDVKALARHGVELGWTGGVNKRSVAELALCFILGICHNVFLSGFALKQNRWMKDGGRQLSGKTVGVVGCGHIGQEVIRLLSPFGCRFLVYDILDKSEFCGSVGAVSVGLDELIRESDVISLHVPLTELTRRMINSDVIGNMKPGAYLINTSRGEVVDQQSLKNALRENRIAGAALDVFAKEPPNDPEFLAYPNLMVTPHIGGNTMEAVEAMGRAAIEHLVTYFRK
ncbi:MAG: hydroxyacid dehydrogenase [Nitrospinae bacterium RIFCSPLOWO2_12_FULL_47_7]|nr:MAG: hydroxyacid dehydrogenase [Nitrospinae bacterium RIFCSPLOWO2_12_FULL_47_7]